jgi:hypothetical protein
MKKIEITICTLGICAAFFMSATSVKAENAAAFPDGQAQQNSMNSGGPAVSPFTGSANPTASPATGSTGLNIPSNTGLPDSQSGIKPILEKILVWMLGIFGTIALISFVVSGLQYLTSAGSDTRMESAKRNMIYAIIGVVIALSAVVVIQAVDAALRGSSTF